MALNGSVNIDQHVCAHAGELVLQIRQVHWELIVLLGKQTLGQRLLCRKIIGKCFGSR